MIVKITLDSSCLNARRKHSILNLLDGLESDGKIEIFTPTTVWREQYETQHISKWRKLYLERVSRLRRIYEIGVVGTSRVGYARVAGDNDVHRLYKITQICFPNKTWHTLDSNERNDVMALEAHSYLGLDFFITLNKKNFIEDGRKERLELGIKVREPNDEFIKEIQKIINS